MNGFSRPGLLCYLILAFSPAVQAKSLDSGRPKMSVQIYNYARVPSRILDQAREVTLRIFDKSGVDLVWLDMGTADQIDLPLGTLAVVIYERPPYPTRSLDTMGAEMTEAIAGVFYDRVESLANAFSTAKAVVMGHVIAHELGHVLHLPHSSTGIMRRSWPSKDFLRATTGELLFTPQESERVRSGLFQQKRN